MARTRPSPLQNRCAPDGTLHAVPERGSLMGNRGGRFHREDATLGRRRWASRAWIACETEYRGMRRQVMGAGYTEVFFLDEATALAAGHRPCFFCRRPEAVAFAAAWARGRGLPAPPRAPEIDRVLHAERLGPRERLPFAALPDGAMFAAADRFFLKAGGRALAWSFAGYRPAPVPDAVVAAVTPASVRAALAAGYAPRLHESALRT
jgi:hypothetical protein